MLSLKQGLGLNTIKTSAAGFDNLYSLDFDGVDDYLHLGNGDALTPNSSGANRGFSISFWINSSVKSQQVFSNTDIADGNWHHIVFAWELGSTSTSIQGYLDGVNLRGGTTYASSGTWVSVSNTAADLRLAYQGGSYGEIMLDEFAIFDDNLTLPQVTEIYNSGVPNDLSSIDYLVGWWRMGDPDGTSSYPTITDQSSNSNDGTMTNMASGDIVTDVP